MSHSAADLFHQIIYLIYLDKIASKTAPVLPVRNKSDSYAHKTHI